MVPKVETTSQNPETITDKTAKRLFEVLEHQTPIQKLRQSHVITTISGTAGLVLLIAGIEKLFVSLSGWASVIVGLILLAISGTLVSKIK
jgi:hypothetical protein